MGRRGPKARPPELRVLEGVHLERVNHDRPQVTGEADCPDHLPDEAKAEWARLMASWPPGFIAPTDRAALATYCTAWALHKDALEKLSIAGSVVKTKDGNVIQNPWLAIVNKQATIMATYASRFGLTPSDRNGVRAPEARKESKWAGLITS